MRSLFLALAAWTIQAHAVADLSGRVFSNIYLPVPGTSQKAHLIQQVQGLSLQYDPHFGEGQGANVDVLGLYYTATADPSMARSEAELREAYYRFHRDGIELRAGRQIISWGKTDVISPTDFLIGQDFRRFTPLTETRRLGADGVQVSFVPNQGDSAWSFTGVWNFDFAHSTVLLPPGSTSTHSEIHDAGNPPVTWDNSEVALKASYAPPSWDLALLYFRGFNHTAQLTKGDVTGGVDPVVAVEPRYTRVQSFGLDASYSFSRWVWRLESAYTKTDNDGALTAMYQPSHLDAVMGLERPFLTNWRVQAQALARYFPHYRDPASETGLGVIDEAINQALAKANSLQQGYDRSWKAGGTLRLSYGNDETTWNPEVFLISYPATQEVFIRPRVLWRTTSSLQFDAGMDRYVGPRETVIGRYTAYSAYFLEGRLLF
jgi:hypothetical protein